MSNYFREQSKYLQMCYGGYCNMCRSRNIEPVYYQKFANTFENNTKTTFKKLHGDRL